MFTFPDSSQAPAAHTKKDDDANTLVMRKKGGTYQVSSSK